MPARLLSLRSPLGANYPWAAAGSSGTTSTAVAGLPKPVQGAAAVPVPGEGGVPRDVKQRSRPARSEGLYAYPPSRHAHRHRPCNCFALPMFC